MAMHHGECDWDGCAQLGLATVGGFCGEVELLANLELLGANWGRHSQFAIIFVQVNECGGILENISINF